MLSDIDATVGAFTAQVNTGQDHGGIPRVKVLVARGDTGVDDRYRHAGTAREIPRTAHAHLVEDYRLLLNVARRVHRTGFLFALLRSLRRRIRRRSRGGGTNARCGGRVRVRDRRAER